ncbi:hypothetical protein B0A55_07747 [Friedmanniomyces simplex]|uniref:DUF8032 domain-containing protein n=1 Tax=Friedmanniomyces simplex TaxID=329884 RepID=A0A4U0XDF4_9PEZI|nr:hypothetical protein B0A55_07747 [Friedmanniomyces simplex]
MFKAAPAASPFADMFDAKHTLNHQTHLGHGLPPPQPLQHPRSAGLIQQHRPQSPHSSQNLQTISHGNYIQPSSHSLPQQQQHQSPYPGPGQGAAPQHPGETTFFGAHPSPYSTHSATGSYASSGEPPRLQSSQGARDSATGKPNETMATQAAISRPPFPPLSSYQTPQSNSPASIHSPQTDAHGRPLYQMQPMPHQTYYQYPMPQQSPYAQHPSAAHYPSMTSAPGMLMSHQQSQQHPVSQQPQHQPSHPQTPMIDTKPSQSALQRPPSVVNAPQGTPQTPSGPAPGPIPATTPLVVRQDNTGVQWIAFEYSRDRVKMEYTIRCDVESVNVDELSQEFKSNNCVYPRACCNKDTYKGNRLHYESECNAVGWALAQLNPVLRDKRGLIQRAVDSWRNSNQDPRLRSRRVRRMAKITNRKATQITASGPGSLPGPQGPASAGLPPHQGMPPRAPGYGPGPSQMHLNPEAGGEGIGGMFHQINNDNGAPAHHHQAPPHGHPPDLHSPSSARYTQNFYPSYPAPPGAVGSSSSMPSVHDVMDPAHSQAATMASTAPKDEEEESKRALFGDLPKSKQRKFILVEDQQRGTRVRVRVMLDQVKMDDMPDAHLRINAVYPRSYFPRQMRSPPGSPHGSRRWDDEDDEEVEGASGTAPTRGKTTVAVPLMDGSETTLSVPRMTKSRRVKEVALNELGYRMAWGQARTFHGRTLFLQRSLDAYRNKMRSTMLAAGQDVAGIAPHFETRPGKSRWLARMKLATKTAGSP